MSERVVYAGDLSEDQIRGLLHACRALISPSLYEGFGLPPVEAALLGREVVASDIAPHREVLKHAQGVEFLSPHASGAWVQAIRRLDREAPRAAGLSHEIFSHTRFAQELLRLYLKCVDALPF